MLQQHNILKISLSLLLMIMGMCSSAQNVVLQESFDNILGKGGNDNQWSGIILDSFSEGDMSEGWSGSPAADGKATIRKGYKCVCIGATLDSGSTTDSGNAFLTTPIITVPGIYIVYFKAGAWNASKEKQEMQITETETNTVDIEQSQFNLNKGTFLDYSTKITVKKANVSIRFGNIYKRNNRFFIDEIKIVKVGDQGSIDPEFSFSQSACTVSWTEGDVAVTTPTLSTNVNTDKIVYSSSEEKVATVDTKGVVTVHDEGTTTITATFEGDDNFNAATASYKLNVVKSNYVYKRATTFEVGKEYLIVSEDSKGNWYIADPTSSKNSNFTRILATLTKIGMLANGSNTYDTYLIRFLTSGKSYTLQSLKTSLYISSNSSNTFTYSTSRGTDWAINDNPFGEDGRFIVKCNDRYLRMSEGNNNDDFRTYKDETDNQRPIFLYEKVVLAPSGTITINAKEGYGTFYSDKSIIMPEGLCGATVTDVTEGGKLKYNWKYNAGDVVPANTGLLLYTSQPGSFEYYEATESTSAMQKVSGLDQTNDVVGGENAQEVNYLHGTTTDETITEDESTYKFYQLTYGTINGTRTIGFFFENANGGVFLNKANKAYLCIPRNVSANSAFSLDKNNPIMSIAESLIRTNSRKQIYDTYGHRIATTDKLQKGIYIVNGKKLIIR